MNDLISILAIVDSMGMMLVMALNRSMNELFLFNGVLTNGFVFSFERIFLSCNQEIRLFLLLMMIVMNNRWRISISKMFRWSISMSTFRFCRTHFNLYSSRECFDLGAVFFHRMTRYWIITCWNVDEKKRNWNIPIYLWMIDSLVIFFKCKYGQNTRAQQQEEEEEENRHEWKQKIYHRVCAKTSVTKNERINLQNVQKQVK